MPQPRRRKAKRKTFHASLLVTRVERWWVEAESVEEARAIFASGQGHHGAFGDLVHVELEHLELDQAEPDADA